MINVLLWGLGKKIDLILNILKRQTDINILGIISRRQCFSYYDGIPMVTEDDIKEMTYDIILATDGNIIKNTVIEPGIKEKIISDRCLKIPGFEFESYLNIRRRKWCIVSEDCWGGMCYHYMQMPFTSPFINIDIPMEDYYKMLEDLEGYLKLELKIIKSANKKSSKNL